MRGLADELPRMQGLVELLLGNNPIGDKGAAMLAPVLPQLPNLRCVAGVGVLTAGVWSWPTATSVLRAAMQSVMRWQRQS